MVSGKPFSEQEKAAIEQLYKIEKKYPSIIARYLSQNFPKDNGGSRSTRRVQEYIRQNINGNAFSQAGQVIMQSIPAEPPKKPDLRKLGKRKKKCSSVEPQP